MALIASALRRAYSANAQPDEVSTSHCTAIYHLFLPQCSGRWLSFYTIYCHDMPHTEATVSIFFMQAQCVCVCDFKKCKDLNSKKSYITVWMLCPIKILYGMVIWVVHILHMSGPFSNLKTHIYHVVCGPAGNKHVYTVQLSWSLFLRQKFKANAFFLSEPTYTVLRVFLYSFMPASPFIRSQWRCSICMWHVIWMGDHRRSSHVNARLS